MKFYTLLGLLAELDNLTLEELLEVKEKVDKLIHSKTSNIAVFENIIISSINQVNNQNDMEALDSMIGLVDEWLQDHSGYDEEVYPLIEAGLIQD